MRAIAMAATATRPKASKAIWRMSELPERFDTTPTRDRRGQDHAQRAADVSPIELAPG